MQLEASTLVLVLGNTPELWPSDNEIARAIFWGPWCFSHHHGLHAADPGKFRFAPNPWKSWAEVKAAATLVDEVFETLIEGVPRSAVLSEAHWLIHFISVALDRSRRLEELNEELRLEGKVAIARAPQQTEAALFQERPNRNIDRIHQLVSSEWNLDFAARLIRSGRFSEIRLESHVKPHSATPPISKEANQLPEASINRWILGGSWRFSQFKGLSLADIVRIKVLARLFRSPFFGKESLPVSRAEVCRPPISPEASRLLELVLDCLGGNPFVGKSAKDGQKVASIYVGHLPGGDEDLNRLTGTLQENGHWICVQHGGSYGQLASFPVGTAEFGLSDRFITWGWKRSEPYHDSKFVPLPSPYLSKLSAQGRRSAKLSGDRILLVGNAMVPYVYRFHSSLMPEHLPQYLDMRARFLQAVPDRLNQKLLYRRYPADYGDREEIIFQNRGIRVQLDSERNPVASLLRSRITVIDHPYTSMLEAFAIGRPLILFWNPAHSGFTEEASREFALLREVGILHDTAESAASHLSRIYDNPNSWWSTAPVQRARVRFSRKYAWSDPNWHVAWARFLARASQSWQVGRHG